MGYVINKMDKPWDFVENFYPNYSTCDDIAHNIDLQKLVNRDYEEGDSAHKLLLSDYVGDINNKNIRHDLNESSNIIKDIAIQSYINSINSL